MWPTTVDMTRDECRSVLRRLELDAYSSVVSTFRAQGHLTDKKMGLLKDLQGILHISADRHRCEARRVACDEELNTVATKIYGPNTAHEWSREGRRTFPFFPRDNIHTALTPAADAAAAEGSKQNSKLPYPADTERLYKPLELSSTVTVVTEESQLVPRATSRKEGKRPVSSQESPPVTKRRVLQLSPGGKGKEVLEVRRESPEKKTNAKRLKNLKWTSPKKSPMSDSEKSNLASRIMHSYASSAPLPPPLKRTVSEMKGPLEEGGRAQLLPQIATSKKDITTNLTKLSQLGTSGKPVKRLDSPGEVRSVNWTEEERPRVPITVQGAVKKVNLTSNSLATLMANGGNIIKKIPSTSVLPSGIAKTLASGITTMAGQPRPKVKIISQQITPAPLTPGTQVKIPAGLNLKTLQGRPDNIKIVTGPSGKMVLKAVSDPVKAKVAKNLQTVVLPAKASNNVFRAKEPPPRVVSVENNVVVLDVQQEQGGVQPHEGGFASQITEDTPVDILPSNEDVLESARANLRTIRVPKRAKVVTTDWEEELDTQTNHIRTRLKSGEDDDSVEYTYLSDECEQIEEDEVTLEDSSVDMVDDAIVEEDFHENGQVETIEEDMNGGGIPKISIETLITAGQILESNEMAMQEQECSGIK